MAKRGFFMYWFTPLGRMRDAAGSLTDALRASSSRIKSVAQTPGPLDPRDVRSTESDRERFTIMYELYKWTPEELVQQKRALRVGKITALTVAAVVFIVSLGLIAFSAPMVQLFAMPMGILLTVLSLAQAFRYALHEAQVDSRALISAKTFLSLPDFWSRVLR